MRILVNCVVFCESEGCKRYFETIAPFALRLVPLTPPDMEEGWKKDEDGDFWCPDHEPPRIVTP